MDLQSILDIVSNPYHAVPGQDPLTVNKYMNLVHSTAFLDTVEEEWH